jgi:hypothetical protein
MVAFVSGRNPRMSDWAMEIRLLGPNGESFGPGSPELTVNPFYLFINVPNPSPGDWRLVATPAGGALQQATVLAFIDNPDPDFFVSVRPNLIEAGERANIAANPSYVSRLGAEGVTITGVVTGPEGFSLPLTMTRNETGAWSATAGPFLLGGLYRATLALDVAETAAPAPGEVIFAGPAVPPVSVTPFKRFASAGFVVVKGERPACESGNREDCDADGVPGAECEAFGPDVDRDGRPNGQDPDADGDEIPDAVERELDLDQNRVPDMCEPSRPKTAPPPRAEREGADVAAVAQADGGEVSGACTPIRPLLIEPVLVGRNWRLNDGNWSLFDFGADRDSAQRGQEVLRHYRVSHLCYAGRKGRSLSYFLVDGKAPAGPVDGEACEPLPADRLAVSEAEGGYAWKAGEQTVRRFDNRAEAEAGLAAVRRYGFTMLCRVGKGEPPMVYLRR